MDRIPILRMGRALLVTIQIDLQDQVALQLAMKKAGYVVTRNKA